MLLPAVLFLLLLESCCFWSRCLVGRLGVTTTHGAYVHAASVAPSVVPTSAEKQVRRCLFFGQTIASLLARRCLSAVRQSTTHAFSAATTKPTMRDYPKVELSSRKEMRGWLHKHHDVAKGAWFITRKQSAGGTIAWNDIVEEVLCYGWIDSLRRTMDDDRSKQLVTPRKPKSNWSAKNKAHVADLETRGLMHASGRAVVEAAKVSGTWAALDQVSALVVPSDLEEALAAAGQEATENFAAFPPSARRGILEWVVSAKRPETRANRVNHTARLAAENKRALDWRDKKQKEAAAKAATTTKATTKATTKTTTKQKKKATKEKATNAKATKVKAATKTAKTTPSTTAKSKERLAPPDETTDEATGRAKKKLTNKKGEPPPSLPRAGPGKEKRKATSSSMSSSSAATTTTVAAAAAKRSRVSQMAD
jgi:uncharacterized protein YdeI (YjbR/CyaY-like superfamily)